MNEFNLIKDDEMISNISREDIEEDLIQNYRKPGHPIAFSGINQIYEYYSRKLPINRIKQILSSIESYTLHREFHKQPRNISFTHFKRYQFQMDLVEVQQLAKYNNNVRYLLNVIDTFTRFAFVRPLINKQANTVLEQFKDILREAQEKPYMIVLDKGTEFMNQQFINFCKSNKILLINPQSNVHAAYIERFNRTLQNIMYKYMTENETNKYIDVLQDLVATYNNRKHRMIQMTPAQAESDSSQHIKINLSQAARNHATKQQNPKYTLGTYVRIAKQKGKFSRGYQEQTQQEIFKIYKIDLSKKIPLYHLETYNGDEKIKGGFYSFELTPVSTDIFRIEKIIKKRTYRGKKQLFVKWKGFDDKYNSWVDEKDVQQSF